MAPGSEPLGVVRVPATVDQTLSVPKLVPAGSVERTLRRSTRPVKRRFVFAESEESPSPDDVPRKRGGKLPKKLCIRHGSRTCGKASSCPPGCGSCNCTRRLSAGNDCSGDEVERPYSAPIPGDPTPLGRPANIGLLNMGNTCFVNSLIQALQFSPGVLCRLQVYEEYLMRIPSNRTIEDRIGEDDAKGLVLVRSLARLYRKMAWLEANEIASHVQPRALLKSLYEFMITFPLNDLFGDGNQHDAQEALLTIFRAFETTSALVKQMQPLGNVRLVDGEEPKTEPTIRMPLDASASCTTAFESTSRVDEGSVGDDGDLFTAMAVTYTKCMEMCQTVSQRPESLNSISVPFEKKDNVATALETLDHIAEGDGDFSSDDECDAEESKSAADDDGWMLRAWSQSCSLRDDDKYSCSKCGHKCEAIQWSELTHCPPILVFHQKRFAVEACDDGVEWCKILEVRPTPRRINVQTSTTKERPPVSYDLCAVVVHAGSTLSSGHYYALVNTPKSSEQCGETDATDDGLWSLSDSWKRCDDETISNVVDFEKELESKSSSPYLLFYSRRYCSTGEAKHPPLD